MKAGEIKRIVRDGYSRIARQKGSCCGNTDTSIAERISRKIGYNNEELEAIPEGANLGLGCGNPVALASIKEGETVLDLGSGAGIDCFLAAERVGKNGKVIGIDMTPEMIDKANENARKGNYTNVEFRLGEIENLPVDDNSVDAVISNCVINLVPDKRKAFKEAFRVLKSGGRLMISDMVLLKDLPAGIKDSVDAYIGCVSGAIRKDKYINAIETGGFQDIRIINEARFPIEFLKNDPVTQKIIENLKILSDDVMDAANSIASVKVWGVKPSKERPY